jgi:hypothetical protein
MKIALWMYGCLVLGAAHVAGDDQLKMTVSPIQSFAPSVLRVHVRIEPSMDNRSLEVIADSDEFYRSSEIPLDGDQAPATINLEFPRLPEGNYRVVGILKDSTGHDRSIARERVRIIGTEGYR